MLKFSKANAKIEALKNVFGLSEFFKKRDAKPQKSIHSIYFPAIVVRLRKNVLVVLLQSQTVVVPYEMARKQNSVVFLLVKRQCIQMFTIFVNTISIVFASYPMKIW